jgi:hypothetical protein
MTEPTVAKPAVAPPQFVQFPGQAPGMYANHIMVGSDGNVVFLTFSQATPLGQPNQASGEMQKFQNMPMIASPVAKIVLVPNLVPQLIKGLQDISHQLEQQQQSP